MNAEEFQRVSDVFKDWRDVPRALWPALLVPVYLERLELLGAKGRP